MCAYAAALPEVPGRARRRGANGEQRRGARRGRARLARRRAQIARGLTYGPPPLLNGTRRAAHTRYAHFPLRHTCKVQEPR